MTKDLVAAILRPGTAPTTVGVPGLLRRLLPKLWQAFPGAAVRVRLDGGFASPAIFDLLEDAGVEYVVAMAKNPVLLAAAAPSLVDARTAAGVAAQSARVFADTTYQAKTWRQARRVIIKAEVVVHPGRDLRDNPRCSAVRTLTASSRTHRMARRFGHANPRVPAGR